MTTNPQPAVRVGAARYRKKPVVIEAVQWDGDQRTFDMIERWVGKAVSDADGYTLLIPTLEGVMEASLNDWIIRGVKGEVYPCKPDIFAITYEPALTPAPTEAGGVREPTKAVIAALAAAISLLERTPRAKKAAPSDRMFDQMLTDYRKALEDGRAALSSTPAADAGWQRPEDTAEQFIQAAVDRAPEPLRRLGEWLARVLDDDEWKTAERMLLGAAVHPADPRDEFELWAGDDNRDLAAQEFEERDPDNFLFYAADSTNQAYIGWYFASRPTPQPGGAR